MKLIRSVIAILLISLTLTPILVWSQEETATETENADTATAAATTETATETENAAAATETENNSSEGAAAQAEPAAVTSPAVDVNTAADNAPVEPVAGDFDAVFTQWKTLLKTLRDVQVDYQVAEQDELAALSEKWNATIAEGEALVPRLRDAALEKYLQQPNVDREITRLLVGIAQDDFDRDNYDSLAKIAITLAENGCQERGINRLAGIAAFVENDFAKAEKYLGAANAAGTLGDEGQDGKKTQAAEAAQSFLANLDDYKKFWPEEQKIRAAEATADDLPRVKLTTDVGDIEVELFENEAPETVGNFVSLVEKGFYDGLTFHRVMKGFMAQGGCPKGDGSGGPGYKIYCECVNDNHRKHFRGSLSMAKTAARNTGGSQFFITIAPTAHLNGQHTVFGRVINGLELVSKIQRDPDPAMGNATKIIKAEVVRKREHEYEPNKVQ